MPIDGWGNQVYFCIYDTHDHEQIHETPNQLNFTNRRRTDIDLRDPDQFFMTMKGPALDIKKLRGNYGAFKAWRYQWSAFVTSSGLGNLWNHHPEDADNDKLTDRSKHIQQKAEKHHLAALHSAMTPETLQIINNMDGIVRGKVLTAEATIDAIGNFITASKHPR